MNLNGWVQTRRGVLEHLRDGHLSKTEDHVFLKLLLIADASTGGGAINAPVLCFWMGHTITQDTAQEALKSLHEKGYIWYRSSNKQAAQPYFVNKYLLTRGPMSGRRTNLSQLKGKKVLTVPQVLAHADVLPDDDPDVPRMSPGPNTDVPPISPRTRTGPTPISPRTYPDNYKKEHFETGNERRETQTDSQPDGLPGGPDDGAASASRSAGDDADAPAPVEMDSAAPPAETNEESASGLPKSPEETAMALSFQRAAVALTEWIYRNLGREQELNDDVRARGMKSLTPLITNNETWTELKTLAHYAVYESREHTLHGREGEFTWYETVNGATWPVSMFAKSHAALRGAVSAYRALKAKEREQVRKGAARKSVLDKQSEWFRNGTT